MKSKFVWILVAILFLLQGCGNERGFKNLSSTLVWDKNTGEITAESGTRHIWSGFSLDGDRFKARNRRGMLVLWRRQAEEKTLVIEYSSRGEPVKLFFNKKENGLLPPTNKWIQHKAGVMINRGFNFIEFRKMKRGLFKIKSIKIEEDEPESRHDLSAGEFFARYVDRGKGRISVKGRGKLLIRKVVFVNGEKQVEERILSSGFLSGRKDHDFSFDSLGVLKCTCLAGHFRIVGFDFDPESPEETGKHLTFNNKPDVFIFLIDGCQASHMKVYGYHRSTSPTADALAVDGVVFDNAYANATFTRSSVATLFTGYFPQRHKLRILTNKLPSNLFLMAEFFKILKYRTSLFTEAANIAEVFGFSQGIDLYRCFSWMRDHPNFVEGDMLRQFCGWVRNPPPLFSYVHFRAPHLPLLPPAPFLDMFKSGKKQEKGRRLLYRVNQLKARGHRFTQEEVQDVTDDYDSTIRFVDEEVGKYINCLKARGLYDESLIIYTSDHGEALYEHGHFGHGGIVYDEASRVPLIVKFPKGMNLKGRVDRVVQLADIFPTISRLFGQKGKFDGQSLIESIEKGDIDDTFAFSTSFHDRPAFGIRWRNWYYIIDTVDNSEELFKLDGNPQENVFRQYPDVKLFFKAKLLSWLVDYDKLERESLDIDLKKLPRDIRHNLKSLGYID